MHGTEMLPGKINLSGIFKRSRRGEHFTSPIKLLNELLHGYEFSGESVHSNPPASSYFLRDFYLIQNEPERMGLVVAEKDPNSAVKAGDDRKGTQSGSV